MVKNIIYANAKEPGTEFIYVGAKTGRDGIGGAEMASKNMKEDVDKDTVQKSDPFLGKLLLEACCELAEADLIDGMQDMGAAGLLCSTSEIINRGNKKFNKNMGGKIYLDKIPKKYEDMKPEEILLSETQERMMIVSKKENREKIFDIFKKWDLEVEVIGEVTDDGRYTIVFDNEEVSASYDEIFPDIEEDWELKKHKEQDSEYKKLDKESVDGIWQRYDWMVGLRTEKGPNKSGFYSILNIPEIGKKIVISWSSDEGRSVESPERGIEYAFNNCLKHIENNNAKPLGMVNGLNFGHPKESMYAFEKTIKKLAELCNENEIPIVGGNVSLYNSFENHSIKPTPFLVMIGLQN